jgi:hypothetical protein
MWLALAGVQPGDEEKESPREQGPRRKSRLEDQAASLPLKLGLRVPAHWL